MAKIPIPSRTAILFEGPLPAGHFGSVNLGVRPYEIVLNERILPPRKQLSLTHELLHIWSEQQKMHSVLPHDKLHTLASFVIDEILPVLLAHSEYHEARGVEKRALISQYKKNEPHQSSGVASGSRRSDLKAACDCYGSSSCAHRKRRADDGCIR